jgi:hypothetical protein
MTQLLARTDAQGYERVVFAEVLVPETPNVYNDYWTYEAVREAAYLFMQKGFGIDLEHDNIDLAEGAYVVESFIARDNDPDFIRGSWVIGMRIASDALWQQVLDNEINGYSFEGLVAFMPATLTMNDDRTRVGMTEPDTRDGHIHTFVVMVGEDNRPLSGGTSTVNGHSHDIISSTTTEAAFGHTHRYQLVKGEGGK